MSVAALTIGVLRGLLTLPGGRLVFLFWPEMLSELAVRGVLLILAIGILLLDAGGLSVGNLPPAFLAVVLLTVARIVLGW